MNMKKMKIEELRTKNINRFSFHQLNNERETMILELDILNVLNL